MKIKVGDKVRGKMIRTNFDNCKVRIANEEESRKVQERLFELNYTWRSRKRELTTMTIHIGRIYVHPTGQLGWDRIGDDSEPNFEEVTVADILGEVHIKNIGGFFWKHKMYQEGTFMWAVEQMKAGKKVRRKGWINCPNWFMSVDNSMSSIELKEIIDQSNQNMTYCILDIEATDWEIFEEPRKTLWDKMRWEMVFPSGVSTVGFVDRFEVEEALRGYFEEARITHSDKHKELREKWFGKELVE